MPIVRSPAPARLCTFGGMDDAVHRAAERMVTSASHPTFTRRPFTNFTNHGCGIVVIGKHLPRHPVNACQQFQSVCCLEAICQFYDSLDPAHRLRMLGRNWFRRCVGARKELKRLCLADRRCPITKSAVCRGS